jgi:hypothetical protein
MLFMFGPWTLLRDLRNGTEAKNVLMLRADCRSSLWLVGHQQPSTEEINEYCGVSC